MFSSLASYFFGTNSENPNSETQQQAQEESNEVAGATSSPTPSEGLRGEGDVIEVTSRTPSVTGGNRRSGKRNGSNGGGKNRRGKKNQAGNGNAGGQRGQRKSPPTITKLLTPNGEHSEEEFDEEEWFIVEKEDEEQSLPRSDSEEEVSVVEVQQQQQQQRGAAAIGAGGATARRRQHINSHSLYSGPRPQQQRNYLQRTRNGAARAAGALSISTLSPPRNGAGAANNGNGGVTQSLFVAPAITASPCGSDHESNVSGSSNGANMSMEESWYVTPPPCFTSIGPINMETSPFENLLIEHPSMSVYHSIRSAQEATESFINLDLGVNNVPQQQQDKPPAPTAASDNAQTQAMQQRGGNNNVRLDRQAAAQLKQQALARSSQKSNSKKDHQKLCRGAIKRSNKVRDYQSKSNRPRRSDMQHCKLNSGANNNRKCYF